MGVSSSRESRRGLLLAVSKLKREGCAPGRNPVKEEASVRFWRQGQSPECGGLVVHHHLRVSLQRSLLHCLKAFHSSKENKPSTIFPVCRGLPFKKHPSLPSIRHAS